MANRKNTFLIKRSNVAGKVPAAGDLFLGELALNTADNILYASGTTANSILPIGWDRVARTGDTMTGGLFTPYLSATTISATSINKVDYIVFNTGTTSAATEAGTVYFDNTEKALSYNTSINQGVTVNLGQQNYIRVFNNTGIDIPRGKCLELLSAYSGLPSVTLAINKHEGFNIIGVSSEIIPNNSEGIAITYGIISDIELTGMSVGSLIYASDKIPGELDDSSKYLDFPLTARTNSVGYVVQTGATIGKLFVNINNENSALSLTDLERNVLEGNTLSSGVFEYTGMTKTSSTTFNISPLKGWIVNNTYENALKPNVTGISYSGVTGQTTPYLLTDVATYVLVNSASTLTLINTFPTPQQRRENIFLGRVAHPDKTTIVTVNNTVDYDVSPMSSLRDLWTPLKLINENVVVSPNGANLSFNSSSGTLWGNGIGWSENQLNPNTVNITGSTPTTFQYRVQTGGTYTDTTTIDPAYYDLNGVRTLVGGGSNSSTNQRIYLYPNRQYRIQYGQKVYSNLAEAIVGTQTESFVTFVNNRDNAILIGILSVNKNATSLNNTGEAVFSFVSKFGELLGGTGGISTTTLQQAYDNSSQPEIVINSILDGLSIKNGTGNADNITRLLEGQTATSGVTSFIRADGYISGTTFQSNGFIANSNGLTATTVSATTYQNLPIDIYTTGGTYTSGNATFTNNTGGTFNVTGFNTGDTTLYWYSENATPPTTTPVATGSGSIALGDGAQALGTDMFVYGTNTGSGATGASYSNFIGSDAGNGAINVIYSNFFGRYAGQAATNAYSSNFFGNQAGYNATDANSSNFIGETAGRDATNANNSNFFGVGAGYNATDAYSSNFMGADAGNSATNANDSNFFGYQAGYGATSAYKSNFFGYYAGYQAIDATFSNFFGQLSGFLASGASYSNFFGYNAGGGATNANYSNFFGNNAGYQATNAYRSNFFGDGAGENATNAFFSNFFGENAGINATGASQSNFFGENAGQAATNAYSSNFFGYNTGYLATDANNSNFLGASAGYLATDAYNSNFIGQESGYQATNANDSNFMGYGAGNNATNAYNSNFFGYAAGQSATNAFFSNFIGYQTGLGAINARDSNFIGDYAGYGATDASYSNFIGFQTGYYSTDASYSNLFGYNVGGAFTNNNIGSNNIIIGTNISLPSGATDSLNIGGVLFGVNTYNTIIGDASITPNNGKIGINIVTPTETLHVSGNTLIEGTLSAITYLNLPTDTLQQAYTASTAPRIITNNDLGAFRVQNGTGTDTNINFAIENNAGDVTGYWDGNGDLVANIISGDTLNASGDINGYSLVSTQSINDEGGELRLATPQTNSSLSGGNITFDVYQNKLRFFESGGSNRGVYIDLTAAATGVGTNLLSGGGGEVNTASNLGSGAGLYAQKVSADLQFKSLTSTGGTVNISSNSTTVNLEVIPASNFTGGTVTGGTIFTNGLTANTISATTYLNLPTIITNVVNLITVGLSGSTGVDYNSIKTAVDSITDSSESNRYLVSVGPGTYVEGEIDLSTKPYVSVEGSNIISTQVIPSGSTQHIFKLGQNNELSFLALFGAPTGYAGIYVYDVGDYAQAHKVSFTDCDINVWIESNSQDTVFFGEYLDFNGSYSYGIKAIGNNGYEALANMENYYNYPSGTGVTICNYAQGSGATLNIFVGDNSSNGVSGTTAYLLEDGAQLNTTTITLDGFTYGIRNANVGSPVSFDVDNVSSVNCEWDLYIENPFTTGTFGGSSNHEKIYNVSENIAWAFLDVNDGEFDITRKISVTFQDGSHTDLSTLVFKGGTMGVISGGTLTNVSGTTIETSAGFGYLEKSDNSGIVRRIDWGNTQIILSANTNNYLFFNENSLLSSSGTAPKDTHNIILGRVVTDSTSVSFIDSTPVNADHTANRFSSLFREGLGPIYAFGSIVTENTTPFKIDVSAGEYYFSTNEILPSGGTEVSFTQYYRDGIGGWNTSATTFVNNTHYDGNGSLSGLTASAYTKHTLYLVGDGSNEKYFLVLGQNEYPTLVQAEDALLPTPPTFFNDSVVQIANIYVRQGFSGITQFEDIRPVIGFKAGGVNASSLHANLLGLASDDHTQYLLADGDRSMSGNLNMGTNNITNVGTVDGVTVSSHAGRHLPNGLDPLTTSTPVDISTSNQIGIANALARSDHQHALGSNIVNDSNISAHTSTKITIIDKTLLNPYIIYSDQVISGLTATTISATTVNVDNMNINNFSANIISGTTLYGDGSNITNIAAPYGIIYAMASGNFLT